MKNVLITGGAGFIGSNLAMTLQEQYPEARITVLDDFRSAKFKNLLGFKGDVLAYSVADPEWLFWAEDQEIDHIFHMASITDTTILDEHKMMYDNVEGFRNILDLAVEKNAYLTWASSAAVYGSQDTICKEEDAGNPNNIYGFSKWAMENLARMYYGKTKKIVGLRFFNVFGPREYYKGHAASMIYQLALQMLDGKTPKIFKYGEQARDQIYVKDLVSAILQAHTSKENTVMNLGTGKPTSFNEIISSINEALGTSFEPEYIDNPYDFYQNFTQADMSHHKNMTGFECQYTSHDAIIEYVRDYIIPLKEANKVPTS